MEKKFRITVEGRPYLVTVEDLTDTGSLIYPEPGSMQVAASASVAVPAPRPAAAAAPAGPPGAEPSPLGGVVHSVEVVVGQEVNEGDRLATIEAMKMQTVVLAHYTGRVQEILVKPGDAVEAGQTLLIVA